jgi:Recombinase
MKKISACPSWLGLSEDRRSFVYFSERAEIVRKIYELSIGGYGSYSIANYLNRQNVPPFPPASKWDHTTIDSMLRNRATFGEHQPKSYAGGNKKGKPVGNAIADYYPAVITREIFESAQKARRKNLSDGRGRRGQDITNLFTGLTVCDYCGRNVKFANRKSLICENVLEDKGCIRVGWSYRDFERSVLYFLMHPALRETIGPNDRPVFDKLVSAIWGSQAAPFASRFEMVPLLKQAITSLRLASGGVSPTRALPDAIIKRDQPGRFFRVRLWDGHHYKGFPVEVSD